MDAYILISCISPNYNSSFSSENLKFKYFISSTSGDFTT